MPETAHLWRMVKQAKERLRIAAEVRRAQNGIVTSLSHGKSISKLVTPLKAKIAD
jgi:hypothetical protein